MSSFRPSVFLGMSLLIVSLLAGVAGATGGDTEKTIISLQDIDCQSCGTAVAELLEAQSGVTSVEFDRDAAELELTLDEGAPEIETLMSLIHRAGYQAVVGAGAGRYLDPIEFPEELDVEWISRAGEAVDVEASLVADKVTVVDFYAVWCGPCREVDAAMREILADHEDVALRKINVVDWSSPIAKQELRSVSGLPYVRVYTANGKRVAAISGLDLDRLHSSIEKARRR